MAAKIIGQISRNEGNMQCLGTLLCWPGLLENLPNVLHLIMRSIRIEDSVPCPGRTFRRFPLRLPAMDGQMRKKEGPKEEATKEEIYHPSSAIASATDLITTPRTSRRPIIRLLTRPKAATQSSS